LFLHELAPRTAAATQTQALCAVQFLYRDVLKESMGDLGKWARAQRPKRMPTWLTQGEMSRLLEQMHGRTKAMAQMAYGSGLRLAEMLNLRIKDLDVEGCTITVRGGKGNKDRVTCLARSLAFRLGPYLARVRSLFEGDRAAGRAPVYLPDGLERKYPNKGREWPWFWVWPAVNESTDPRTGIVRRHPIHEDTLGKALAVATKRAGISKRVTVHTLRHSFATAFLENGGRLEELKELLGHSHIETTMIYTHVLPMLGRRVVSPLDVAERKVIAFPAPEIERTRQLSS